MSRLPAQQAGQISEMKETAVSCTGRRRVTLHRLVQVENERSQEEAERWKLLLGADR